MKNLRFKHSLVRVIKKLNTYKCQGMLRAPSRRTNQKGNIRRIWFIMKIAAVDKRGLTYHPKIKEIKIRVLITNKTSSSVRTLFRTCPDWSTWVNLISWPNLVWITINSNKTCSIRSRSLRGTLFLDRGISQLSRQ